VHIGRCWRGMSSDAAPRREMRVVAPNNRQGRRGKPQGSLALRRPASRPSSEVWIRPSEGEAGEVGAS